MRSTVFPSHTDVRTPAISSFFQGVLPSPNGNIGEYRNPWGRAATGAFMTDSP